MTDLAQSLMMPGFAGLIDWNSITDRTRNLKALAHWRSPEEILDAVAAQYRIDKWQEQRHRIEVWIEKDALAGVFQRICQQLDVPYFSCRGYTSQSEMHSAAKRLEFYRQNGQEPVILHFGDHDPSGIDMSRDIFDRLDLFSEVPVQVIRLALNMDQVEQYNPPPNPAKITDSRASGYISKFGGESWELDALNPRVLSALVRENVEKFRDDQIWSASTEKENHQKKILDCISEQFWKVEDLFENETGSTRAEHTDLCAGCEDCDPENETGWRD